MKYCRTVAEAYVMRSQENVKRSDGTVAFKIKDSVGTEKTIGFCMTGMWTDVYKDPSTTFSLFKPVLVLTNCVRESTVSDSKLYTDDIYAFCQFIFEHNIRILNVAGHREDWDILGWEPRVQRFLLVALRTLPHYMKAKLEQPIK